MGCAGFLNRLRIDEADEGRLEMQVGTGPRSYLWLRGRNLDSGPRSDCLLRAATDCLLRAIPVGLAHLCPTQYRIDEAALSLISELDVSL